MRSCNATSISPWYTWYNRCDNDAKGANHISMSEEKDQKIEELERQLQELRRQVYYDELTGIYNRRGFTEEVQHVFDLIYSSTRNEYRRKKRETPFSLIFFDVDDFKELNDTYGHDFGDEVLKCVAAMLQENLRRGDIYGRWGGEEFVVAVPGVRLRNARKVAEKLRTAIEKTCLTTPKNDTRRISASFGIGRRQRGDTLEEIYERADRAMYEAKWRGKNRVVDETEIETDSTNSTDDT